MQNTLPIISINLDYSNFLPMKKWIFLSLLVLFFVHQEVFAQGCAQCKVVAEQASSEADESSFGSNINMGILYLMLIPYALLIFLFRKRIVGILRTVFLKK
jgi:hypothetical protein